MSIEFSGLELKVNKAKGMMIYIAGPIAGIEHRNESEFRYSARCIDLRGHRPIIPHDIPVWAHPEGTKCPKGYSNEGGHSSACWLRGDISWLLRCDGILMMNGWHYSRGASLEHRVAVECGLRIFYSILSIPEVKA